MKELKNFKKSETIIASIVAMAIGILLIILRSSLIGIVMTVIGVALIGFGVIDLLQHQIPPAVIKMVIGAVIIVCGWVLVEAVLYILAALMLILGGLLLYDKLKNRVHYQKLWMAFLDYALPAGLLLIGGLLLFNQTAARDVILVICGILTTIEGTVTLINALSDD